MSNHITVLSKEAIEALNIKQNATVVDATFGAGGHSRAILSHLTSDGVYVGIDVDPVAIENAESLESIKKCDAQVYLKTGNFRTIDSLLDDLAIPKVDAILADLGWRMEQMGGNERGFSFRVNEPLIMTYGDPSKYPFTAKDIINEWEEDDITNVLKAYGEERFARRIAQGIGAIRKTDTITHSVQLAQIIEDAVPGFYKKGKVHPATRTFQALRIAVNDELDALSEFIEKAIERLQPKGRLAIITFHSLEDRIVKRAFKALKVSGTGTLVNKKPITPSDEEIKMNVRARSAKLRIFEKNEKKTYIKSII